MQNYKLTIQYDGSRYSGWQVQGNTEQTVQGKLQRVLGALDGGEVESTKGATFFDSNSNSWAARNKTCVAVIGNHKFYK